jgi:hypothetical protein
MRAHPPTIARQHRVVVVETPRLDGGDSGAARGHFAIPGRLGSIRYPQQDPHRTSTLESSSSAKKSSDDATLKHPQPPRDLQITITALERAEIARRDPRDPAVVMRIVREGASVKTHC